MTAPSKDIAPSVRDRLRALAKARGADVQFMLSRYVNERLLYRLASSPYASRFVLKGASLFTLWTGAPHRATRDVDLLGFGEMSADSIRGVFADVLAQNAVPEGVQFDTQSLTVEPIRDSRNTAACGS